MLKISNVKKFTVDQSAYQKMSRKQTSNLSIKPSDEGSEISSVASSRRASMQEEWTLSPGSQRYWVMLMPDTADLTIEGLISYLKGQTTLGESFFTLTSVHLEEIDAEFINSGYSIKVANEQETYSVLSIPFVPEQSGSTQSLFPDTNTQHTKIEMITALERFQERFTSSIRVKTIEQSEDHPFFNANDIPTENDDCNNDDNTNSSNVDEEQSSSCCAALRSLFTR